MLQKIKNNLKAIVIIVLMAMVAYLGSNMMRLNGDLNASESMKAELAKENQIFEKIVSKQGDTISIQKQMLFTKERHAEKLMEEVDGLRKIKQQVKFKTRTVIREIEVPLMRIDSIKVTDSTDASFSRIDPWYEISGKVNAKRLMIDSLVFIDKPTISFGYRKNGLIRDLFKKEAVISYRNENPYSSLVQMSNVIVKPKEYRFSLGPQVGYGFTRTGTSVYLGVGLQYSLLRF